MDPEPSAGGCFWECVGSFHTALAVVVLLAGCSAEVAPEVPPAPGSTAAAPGAAVEAGPEAPDVFLLSIDTFRADRVGRQQSITPNIDRLAERGVVFERAVTPIGTTLPALASTLTGLHPREHGLQWNGGALRPQFTTLAEVFQQSGYTTGAFVSFFDVVHGGGMGQGFDARVAVPENAAANLTAEEVNRQALAWLRQPQRGPILLWVHYLEPHSPYRMTPYARERLPGITGAFADGATVEEFYRYNDPGMATPEARAILSVLYDGEVFEVDRAVGEVLDAIEAHRSGRPTIVVLTADHGQLLGEHDLVGHGGTLWGEILAVPLIVRDSRRAGGRRVSTRVGLVDLFPTLVELAGLEVPGPVSGRSLVPALDGAVLAERHYYAETRTPPPPPLQSAILYGDRKLHKFQGDVSAYDLGDDPQELSRAGPGGDVDSDLVQRLRRFDVRQGAAETPDAPSDEIDAGRNARLVALGYAVEPEEEPQAELSAEEAIAVVQAYLAFLDRGGVVPDTVLDVSRLPYPKAKIRAAVLQMWDATTSAQEREHLQGAAVALAFFQRGVAEGGRPLDSIGPGQQPWRGVVETEMKATVTRLELRSR